MGRLSEDDKKRIHDAFRKTGTIRGTVRQTGISRKAVRREIDRMSGSRPNAPAAAKRKSKLDTYKAKIGYLVREKHLSAIRVLEEIKELGYDGGYSILKDYIRTIRTKNKKIPRPPIDHPPGREAQMDWSPHKVIIGGRQQVVHTGSIVLCYSRWIFFHHFTPPDSIQQRNNTHCENLLNFMLRINYRKLVENTTFFCEIFQQSDPGNPNCDRKSCITLI